MNEAEAAVMLNLSDLDDETFAEVVLDEVSERLDEQDDAYKSDSEKRRYLRGLRSILNTLLDL